MSIDNAGMQQHSPKAATCNAASLIAQADIMGFGNRRNGMVKIIHGANDDEFDIAGATVSRVYSNLIDAFNIPKTALAFVNGEQVDGTYVLRANDTLEFCKQSGRKGIRRMFTKADILREYVSFPSDVLDDLFAEVRHHDTNANGDPIWMESVVDDWLDERCFRRQADDGRDKVIPPNKVRIEGQIYNDLTSLEWRLMDILLTRRNTGEEAVPKDDVIEHVWGHDYDHKDNALKQHVKRVNEKLSEQHSPVSVSLSNGFVTINK